MKIKNISGQTVQLLILDKGLSQCYTINIYQLRSENNHPGKFILHGTFYWKNIVQGE